MTVVGPSPTHRINELAERVAVMERSLVVELRFLTDRSEEDRVEFHKVQDEQVRQAARLAVVEQRRTALEKTGDRTWQVWLALLAAAISLIVSLLKK